MKNIIMATIIVMAFFTTIANVNAFESYIPYGKLTDSQAHKTYIGFHLADRYLWYLNNDEDGFNLDGVLSDEQQKNWDDQK